MNILRRAFSWLIPNEADAALASYRDWVATRPSAVESVELVSVDEALAAIQRERFKDGVRYQNSCGTWVVGELAALLPDGMVEIRQPGTRSLLIERLDDVRPVGE